MATVKAMLVREDGNVQDFELEHNNLKRKQDLVGGYVERIDLDDGAHMWINEEGKNANLKPNSIATRMAAGRLFTDDFIAGPAIFCGDAGGHDADLPMKARLHLNHTVLHERKWIHPDETGWYTAGTLWRMEMGLDQDDVLEARDRMIWRRTDQPMRVLPAMVARTMVYGMGLEGLERIGYSVGDVSTMRGHGLVGIEGTFLGERSRLYVLEQKGPSIPMLKEVWNHE